MLAYTVHDVKISCGTRELPPEDGWRRFESTGVVTLACSCGYSEGSMPKPLPLTCQRAGGGHGNRPR